MSHPADFTAERAPRRVCLVLEKIAARSGGAERVVVETANALAARGHYAEILSYERRGKGPFFPRSFGVVHTNLRRPTPARSRWRRRFDDWREELHQKERTYYFPENYLIWTSQHGGFWRQLERYLNFHQPDVAISFLPSAITALGMVRPSYPLRRIASLHNVPERDLCDPNRWDPNPLDRKRRMASLQQHDAITVLQDEFRDWFPDDLRERISVIPNVVRQLSAARIARHEKQKSVLSVGRLAGVKRHDLLIDAWSLIADEFPDWTLKIFGTGPLESELRDQIEGLDLAEKVRLMGHTANIDQEYLSASIVAHPALHEGWGLAASEALAAGVPVVGFAECPGINRLVRDGTNGILVHDDASAVQSLGAALAKLMKDDALRKKYGSAGPKTVKEFEPERVFDLWEDLLY
jgi:glycosyltransferase involved in cell wall biosynthesis